MILDRSAPLARHIDIAPLRHLLKLASKPDAAALLAALLTDLHTTRSGFDLAWNGPDFAALRAHSHVLIALAGTIGDTDLHASAQQLNALAHGQSLADILAMKARLTTDLSALIDLLASLQTKGWA